MRPFLVVDSRSAFSVARFRFEITPPLHHPLLGGLVLPALAIDDGLEAVGYVLLGDGAPLVVCVLDWAAVSGGAHLAWRTALAEAAGTSPERVAVQCVHQHNAPFVCPDTEAIVARQGGMTPIFEPAFLALCLSRAREAVRTALGQARRVTHVAHGTALVEGVASNRRMERDATGRVLRMRKSACEDPELRALPEGRIDPLLQSIAFYDGDERIVASHYYATHPMSYYRDGRVSSDFCGLARKRRQAEDPGCLHLYFSGCAGNVAAGKYNDGSPAARAVLAERMYRAIKAAERGFVPQPLRQVQWRTEELLPPGRRDITVDQLETVVADEGEADDTRRLAAFQLGWRRRLERGLPVPASCLLLNDIAILHLPGELFVEYQLRARALRAGRPVAVAAYGDDGPWYMPTREEYPAGGYEVAQAFCDPAIDEIMTAAMQRLLR
jgi:hypothetical protein